MAIRIDISDFIGRLEELGEDLEQATVRGLQSAAARMPSVILESIKTVKPYPPEDTGALSRSVQVETNSKGAAVSINAPHARFVEYGTRPHFPPVQALAEWAYRKGLADSPEEAQQVGLAIARKIAKEGTKPRHFLKRAIRMMKRRKIVQEEIRRELDKIKR